MPDVVLWDDGWTIATIDGLPVGPVRAHRPRHRRRRRGPHRRRRRRRRLPDRLMRPAGDRRLRRLRQRQAAPGRRCRSRRPSRPPASRARSRGSGCYQPTPSEFYAVRREFDLHELAVEDAVKAHQRPKLEVYGDRHLRGAQDGAVRRRLRDRRVRRDPAVRRRATTSSRCATARARRWPRSASALEDDPEHARATGRWRCCTPSMDRVVDDYEPVIAGLDNDIREIEVDVFAARARRGASTRPAASSS